MKQRNEPGDTSLDEHFVHHVGRLQCRLWPCFDVVINLDPNDSSIDRTVLPGKPIDRVGDLYFRFEVGGRRCRRRNSCGCSHRGRAGRRWLGACCSGRWVRRGRTRSGEQGEEPDGHGESKLAWIHGWRIGSILLNLFRVVSPPWSLNEDETQQRESDDLSYEERARHTSNRLKIAEREIRNRSDQGSQPSKR